MQASSASFAGVRTSVTMAYPSTGTWDAAYDIWFDPTPRTDGQNTGAEIMVWLNRRGTIQPVGSRVGSATLAGGTWDVWFGNVGWNVVSYVRTAATTSMDFAVGTFYGDAVGRGYAQPSWYLTSVQAGFEPWVGGAGLAVNTFSYTTTGGGDTSPPSAPANLAASSVGATGLTLAWNPSSDNVGVTGYDVLRRQGTSGAFTRIGGDGSTSLAVTGLAASTQYQFQVTAHDAAGNTSAPSNTVTVTTQSGGGGGAGCRVRYAKPSEWGGGFVADIVITNTATTPVDGWTLVFAFTAGQRVTNAWNATVSQAGGTVTAGNMDYNRTIAAGGTVTFGFQGTWTTSNPVPTTFTLNGAGCTPG